MSKIKKFPQAHAQINSHIAIIITTHIFKESTSNIQQNFSTSQNFIPTKFSIPTNISMHIPTKFCHVHKTKFTYTNKLFSHILRTHSYKPNTNFSRYQYPQNPNQNLSNNITIYLHCQNSISHQNYPSYTMIK